LRAHLGWGPTQTQTRAWTVRCCFIYFTFGSFFFHFVSFLFHLRVRHRWGPTQTQMRAPKVCHCFILIHFFFIFFSFVGASSLGRNSKQDKDLEDSLLFHFVSFLPPTRLPPPGVGLVSLNEGLSPHSDQ
jgi:hypothetical protein